MKKVTFLLVAILLSIATANALPPSAGWPSFDIDEESEPNNQSNLTVHNTTYIDANNILSFITNHGNWGRDLSGVFGYDAGFFFPFTSVEDIESGINDNYCLYAAGIWLGGKINGETHVTVAEFSDEFVPGPMENGTYLPDNELFRTYKIDESSGPGDPDYDDWPDQHGAPVNNEGNPLLLGDQTLWAVFNDADPWQHTNNSGETDPMGVEVQMTTWGSDEPGEESVIYIKYKLYNKGSNSIDDFYFSMWIDPDVGGAGDDLVGCDTINDIFFAYNATNSDQYYGTTPPAVGGYLISGPVVPFPGDTAIFDGDPLPDYRNIHMSSFNRYFNGIDPDNAQESYNYMRGLDRDGSPIYYDGNMTKYVCSGDPITGSGWIDGDDMEPSDRRMMTSFGPFDFNPGDSQQVVLKIAAAMGPDRLSSVCLLKNILNNACSNDPENLPVNSIVTEISDNPCLKSVSFDGEPRWLTGVDWGGAFLNGGFDYGDRFFGSQLNPETMPDSFSSIGFVFTDNDPMAGQRAYRYCRACPSENFGYLDYSWVPFQVWDMDNAQQLNICFVEWIDSDVYDGTWGPDTTGDGGREYMQIMKSAYDGDNELDAGTGLIDYTNINFIYDAYDLDIMYGFWGKVADGHSIEEMDDRHKLLVDYSSQYAYDVFADSIVFAQIPVLGETFENIEIESHSSGYSILNYELSDTINYTISHVGFDFVFDGEDVLRLNYHPQDEGNHTAYLSIIDQYDDDIIAEYKLVGRTTGDEPPLEISIEPEPIYAFMKYAMESMTANVIIPDDVTEFALSDVNLSSLFVNDIISPVSVELLQTDSIGDFLSVIIDMTSFIESYPLMWDTVEREYTIGGSINNYDKFLLTDQVTTIGHISGDVNNDQTVNLLDLTYGINFFYKGGEEPRPFLEIIDVNADGQMNVLDLTYIIRYLYKDGPAPQHPGI